MIDLILQHNGVVTLVGFFTFFTVAAVWALLPRNKKKFDDYKNIPLKD